MSSSDLKRRLGPWSTMIEPSTNVDRHKCHRTVPMQVISAGPSRTGTFSMAEAFSILGYANPYHFSSVFANLPDADMWQEALDLKYNHNQKLGRDFFDKLLGHTSAVTDAPCFLFWEELAEAYPEAKVVLVERDEDKWYKSCQGLIAGCYTPLVLYVLRFTDPWFMGKIMLVGYTWYEGWFGTARSKEAIMRNARRAYRAHYAAVRERIPKDRLLEYRLGDGWEPLCEFLGKEVPSMPFPHRNESATLELAFEAGGQRAIKNSLFNLSVVVAGAAALTVAIRYWM